jgi:hypothetical protein
LVGSPVPNAAGQALPAPTPHFWRYPVAFRRRRANFLYTREREKSLDLRIRIAVLRQDGVLLGDFSCHGSEQPQVTLPPGLPLWV